MSTENNDLFEGIQIMTPQELENAAKGGEPSAEDTNKTVETTEDTFSIEPVRPTSGDAGETTEESKITPVEDKPANSQSSNESNKGEVVYKALLKELVKEGVITAAEAENIDELPGTFDTIKELLSKTIEQNVESKQENWKKSLSGEKKRFLEIEDAFDSTDQAIIMAQRLEFFDNLDEETISSDVNLQKQLYYEKLKAKNFSEKEAIEAIEDAEAVNKLQQKALESLPELRTEALDVVEKAKEAKQAKTKEAQEAQAKAFENLLDNIEKRNSFIDGLTLNKISKDKLKANIIDPVYKDPNTGKEYNSLMYKQMKNPVEFEMLINYYDTLGLFNITKEGSFKPDIAKLKAVAKTSAISELDKVIAAEEQRGVGRNTSVETSAKTQSALDILEKAFGNK